MNQQHEYLHVNFLRTRINSSSSSDTASKVAEAEWREKAKKELEDWHVHQSEQMEKNKANNRLVWHGPC